MSDETQLLVSTEDDKELLDNSGMSWDDLNQLKENVGHEIMKLTVRMSMMIGRKDFASKIPVEHRSRAATIVSTIADDIEHYSSLFKKIREKHEDRSGPFNSIDDFEMFNVISMEYMNLTTQMLAVLSPLFGELTLLIPGDSTDSQQEGNHEQVPTH